MPKRAKRPRGPAFTPAQAEHLAREVVREILVSEMREGGPLDGLLRGAAEHRALIARWETVAAMAIGYAFDPE